MLIPAAASTEQLGFHSRDSLSARPWRSSPDMWVSWPWPSDAVFSARGVIGPALPELGAPAGLERWASIEVIRASRSRSCLDAFWALAVGADFSAGAVLAGVGLVLASGLGVDEAVGGAGGAGLIGAGSGLASGTGWGVWAGAGLGAWTAAASSAGGPEVTRVTGTTLPRLIGLLNIGQTITAAAMIAAWTSAETTRDGALRAPELMGSGRGPWAGPQAAGR